MKECPFCAEEIQVRAIKCKHCGEFLATPVNPDAMAEPATEPAKPWQVTPGWVFVGENIQPQEGNDKDEAALAVDPNPAQSQPVEVAPTPDKFVQAGCIGCFTVFLVSVVWWGYKSSIDTSYHPDLQQQRIDQAVEEAKNRPVLPRPPD